MTVNLLVKTSGPNATLQAPRLPGGDGKRPHPVLAVWTLSASLGMVGVVLAGSRRADKRARRRTLTVIATTLLLLALMGCGGGNSMMSTPPPPSAPAGTSMVVVTATSSDGSIANVAMLSLTVTIG